MARLKYLDDWVREILETPRDAVDTLFGREDVARQSIEAMPFYTRHRAGFRHAAPDLLLALHAHVRGLKAERGIWEALLFVMENPLPDKVAHDLIDRDIAVSWLGHSRQSDEVMWRLVELVAESLLTMAKEAYTWNSKSLHNFEQVLGTSCSDNAGREWMLQSLSYCVPSSQEKRVAYFRALEGHAKRDEYIERSTTSAHDVWPTPEQRTSRYTLPQPLDAHATGLLVGHFEHPDGLLGVARDPETPLEILHLLRDLPGSKAIRHAARINLREHQGEEVEP